MAGAESLNGGFPTPVVNTGWKAPEDGFMHSRTTHLTLLHLVNLAALLLVSVILLLTAVTRGYQLVLLGPMLLLILGYWRFRASPRVVAGAFGLSMAVLGWILLVGGCPPKPGTMGCLSCRRRPEGLRSRGSA
jgi:hypothetical protein